MGNGAGSSRLCENIIDKCIDRFTIYARGQSSYGQVIFVDSSVSNAYNSLYYLLATGFANIFYAVHLLSFCAWMWC